MKTLWALLLCPAISWASLIEWTGVGPQTYYWEDQANPTATISILADQDSIHRLQITNTHTTLTYNDVDFPWYWAAGTQRWSAVFHPLNHEPDEYPGAAGTLLHALVGWRIYEPETANPFDHLDQINMVKVGNQTSREFEFVPTQWSTRCVSECGASDVPEPPTFALLGLGLALLGIRRKMLLRT